MVMCIQSYLCLYLLNWSTSIGCQYYFTFT